MHVAQTLRTLTVSCARTDLWALTVIGSHAEVTKTALRVQLKELPLLSCATAAAARLLAMTARMAFATEPKCAKVNKTYECYVNFEKKL